MPASLQPHPFAPLKPLTILLLCAMASSIAGCAVRTAAIPPAPVAAGSAQSVDEEAEPLTAGIKPLTVEQEEGIAQ